MLIVCLGILKLALNSNKIGISKEMCASMLIPFLVPLSIENGLTLQQVCDYVFEIANSNANIRLHTSTQQSQPSFTRY